MENILEKIRSNTALLPLFIGGLYFLGFLTVSSFLARFGIVTFDVINARYLVAGIACFIAIFAAVICIHLSFNILKIRKIITPEGIFHRISAHITWICSLFTVSFLYSLIFSVGKYTPPQDRNSIIFKPLFGKHDYIGKMINYFSFDKIQLQIIWIQWAFNVGLYLLILMAIVAMVIKIVGLFQKNKVIASKQKVPPNIETTSVELNNKPEQKVEEGLLYFFALSCEVLILILEFCLFIFCTKIISTAVFDLPSLQGKLDLSGNIFFVWLYSITFGTHCWLVIINWQKKEGQISMLKDVFSDPEYLVRVVTVPFLLSILYFGSIIYPRIPYAIGGGAPRSVEINLKNQNKIENQTNTFLIGESINEYFIVLLGGPNEGVYQINKGDFNYIKTR